MKFRVEDPEKYEKQLKLEHTITFKMPEVFRDCKEMLTEEDTVSWLWKV